MLQSVSAGNGKVERKIISVSTKRQLTIPQKYYEMLGFNNEVECILRDDGILLRPVRDTGEFSEQILSDLIAQGFSGQTLLREFKRASRQMRPAVQELIKESDALARSGGGKLTMSQLFGPEE